MADRFWDKVDKSQACWEWTAHCLPNGYGSFRYQGRTRYAHRISAYRAGLITGLSDKRHVLHACDNPKCVNPDHLFVGSAADNMADMTTKGRRANGTAMPHSKLTEEDIPLIRADTRTHQTIADVFNVSRRLIGDIKNGKRWSHVP